MGETVFELCHFKIMSGQDFDDYDDSRKQIGIYRTMDSAKAAIERVVHKEGFRDWPQGFRVTEMWLDHDQAWSDGFFNPDEDTTDRSDEYILIPVFNRTNVTLSAALHFSGNRCDSDSVLAAMKYGQAKAWAKSDAIFLLTAYSGLDEKIGGCTFDSLAFTKSADINDHIGALLKQADQNRGELQSIIQRDGLTCSILCYFEDPAEATSWQPTPENLALSARLAIPIRNAETFPHVAERRIADAASECPSPDDARPSSRYLET